MPSAGREQGRRLLGSSPLSAIDALGALPLEHQVQALAETLSAAPDPAERTAMVTRLTAIASGTKRAPARTIATKLADGIFNAFRSAPGENPRDAALAAIATNWARIPEASRTAPRTFDAARWDGALTAARRGGVAARRSAGELVSYLGMPSLAGHAGALLTDQDRDVSKAADRALLSLVLRALGLPIADFIDGAKDTSAPAPSPGAVRALAPVIAAAADRFGTRHRGRGVLLAALLLADARDAGGPATPSAVRLRALLTRTDHPAAAPLKTALKTSGAPHLRARAWRWLAEPALATPATERVARVSDERDHEALIDLAHLAVNPARARRLSAIPVRVRATGDTTALAAECPLPPPAVLAKMTTNRRRAAVALAGVWAMPEEARAILLAPALADPDGLTRHRAARVMPRAGLPDACFDADPRVAASAARRWSHAGEPDTLRPARHEGDRRRERHAALLARSPHACVRAIGREDRARTDEWDHASPLGRVAARRRLETDPVAFREELIERMQSRDEGERLGAILLTRCLRLASRVERDLVHAAAEESYPRAAATAVRELGTLRTPSALAAVAVAMGSPDHRVRANALEAHIAQSADEVTRLTRTGDARRVIAERAHDNHHRARGGAVRGLIEGGATGIAPDARAFDPEGLDHLASMLSDERPGHRLAGVWVAERTLTGGCAPRLGTVWGDLVRAVVGLSERDGAPEVRTRAARCARRMLVELHDRPAVTTRPTHGARA